MGIKEKVICVCQPGQEKPYYLQRGPEWFFDPETRIHQRYVTMEEAVAWCKANLHVTPFEHLPEEVQERERKHQEQWEEEHQPRLL